MPKQLLKNHVLQNSFTKINYIMVIVDMPLINKIIKVI